MTNPVDLVCMLEGNRCYKTGQRISPEGICVHSTGADNPYLRRYVNSRGKDPDIEEILGLNKYANDWNRSDIDACVHAFIGFDRYNDVKCVQTLPWAMRGWHAGKGPKGSLNDTHISFEMCEDGMEDGEYFTAVMDKATSLCAYLCNRYDLDPTQDGVLICHQDGYKMGKASNHGDIYPWLYAFGKDMEWFRKEVANKMQEISEWARPAYEWAKEAGITNDLRPKDYCTREEVLTMLKRFYDRYMDN